MVTNRRGVFITKTDDIINPSLFDEIKATLDLLVDGITDHLQHKRITGLCHSEYKLFYR